MEKVSFKWGLESNIPTIVYDGDVLFCKDSGKLFIVVDGSPLMVNGDYIDSIISELEEKINDIPYESSTVLYEVDINSTNYGVITLSDSAANYDLLKIYAATDDKHAIYVEVPEPNGKMVDIAGALVGMSNYFTKCKTYQITDKSLTTATYASSYIMAGMWGTHNSSSWTRGEEYIGIYKVVGVKYH